MPKGTRRRRLGLVVAVISVAVEAAAVRRRGYGFCGRVFVRCRSGHVFSTIWIPGVSVKAIRLGPWRVQRCPVGGHWSLVTPVARTNVAARDLPIP